ncbi:hypothetical protein MRY87_10455 [bacterium]|nr:hypothetical protein [bacterium]
MREVFRFSLVMTMAMLPLWGASAEGPTLDVYGDYPWQGSVAKSGSSSPSSRGHSQAGIPASQENYEALRESEESIPLGGDSTRGRNVVLNSSSMLRSLSSNIFTSAISVFANAVGFTDSTALSSFDFANMEAHEGAQGTLGQEELYLKQIENRKDAEVLRTQYFSCKDAFLRQSTFGIDERTNIEAIKRCTGGFSTAQASVSTVRGDWESTPETHASAATQRDVPFPLEVEEVLFTVQSPADLTRASVARDKCKLFSATGPSENCFKTSLWSWIFHYVVPPDYDPDPTPAMVVDGWNLSEYPNHEKVARTNWARMYFGNVILDHTPPLTLNFTDGDAIAAQELNLVQRKKQPIMPETRWVNFWRPNGGNFSGVSGNYATGEFVPLSGFNLLKAQYLQDIYGSLQTLGYRMCNWSNRQNEMARSATGGGLTARCDLWNARIDATWIQQDISVPGLGVNMPGCEAVVMTPGVLILPPEYLFLWPSQELFSALPLPSYLEWGGRRFYEHSSANAGGGVRYPTMSQLADAVSFSKGDVQALDEILRLEQTPPDAEGERDCKAGLEGVALGDIMQFEGPYEVPLHWALPGNLIEYNRPAGPSWPEKEEFWVDEDNPTLGRRQVSEYTKILYRYAVTLAEMRTYQTIEGFRNELIRQGNGKTRWPELFEVAKELVSIQLPDGGGLSSTQLRAEMSNELSHLRADLRAHLQEIRSSDRFKAGKRGAS